MTQDNKPNEQPASPDSKEPTAAQGTVAQSPEAPKKPESADSAPTPSAETELRMAKAQAAENYDKYLRMQAEFDNYKKRTQKEQSELLKYAKLPLLKDLTGVLDNLERAVDHARKSADPSPELASMRQGMDMVIKELNDIFTRNGMTRIEAKGKPFDPALHEAMALVETDQHPEHAVVEEFRPGFQLHDRVVRPAMVTVARPPAGKPPAGEPPGPESSEPEK
ncbi:MAG: nucleotide exchange factor GrpE [Deltaproteobacteria bacterium]|nr:nucleotide exchange factor GrpE [Deltaproteobacteria bacterium]